MAATRASLLLTFFDSTLVSDALVRARYEYLLGSGIGYTIQRHLSDHRPPFTAAELARVRAPALFVWCREDRRTPLAEGEAYARALPAGKLVVLERCGHLPNIEQPAAFDRAVLDFLAAASAARTR